MPTRRVDFLRNKEDLKCLVLGQLGYSNLLITARTGLSSGQIAYRLKKKAIRRSDYRNGLDNLANNLIASTLESKLTQKLRENLLANGEH